MREFWNDKMQRRYEKRRSTLWPKVPLKVIVMPHSHNDPGWLKTVDGYFHSSTKHILDSAVDKMVCLAKLGVFGGKIQLSVSR